MNQEVRVKMDVSITIPADWSTKQTEDHIVWLVKGWVSSSVFHDLAYAEERNIYLRNKIKWKSLTKEVQGEKES